MRSEAVVHQPCVGCLLWSEGVLLHAVWPGVPPRRGHRERVDELAEEPPHVAAALNPSVAGTRP